ncbi:hypothetical protein [Jannaschia formosa]|uniref:hypothetical protein n=1 Tax=Jannaschia formosa TaxID=2259592 RepID=UPI0010753FD4|nr:hypothetical protein [Jannaschia formosa]TFL16532.1 hypothetical protein DR046_19680 [Jannaschia formosa]
MSIPAHPFKPFWHLSDSVRGEVSEEAICGDIQPFWIFLLSCLFKGLVENPGVWTQNVNQLVAGSIPAAGANLPSV